MILNHVTGTSFCQLTVQRYDIMKENRVLFFHFDSIIIIFLTNCKTNRTFLQQTVTKIGEKQSIYYKLSNKPRQFITYHTTKRLWYLNIFDKSHIIYKKKTVPMHGKSENRFIFRIFEVLVLLFTFILDNNFQNNHMYIKLIKTLFIGNLRNTQNLVRAAVMLLTALTTTGAWAQTRP